MPTDSGNDPRGEVLVAILNSQADFAILQEQRKNLNRLLRRASLADVRPVVAHLLVRGKPRDVYDLWLMRSKGWPVDWSLVNRKLALYDLEFSTDRLAAALARVAQDWERDLCPLLPQLIPLDDASRAVEAYLLKP